MLSPLKLKDKLFYGWVVVGTFFITGTALWGIRFSFGVFFKSIENEFALTRAMTSAFVSVHMGLSAIFAVLGGWALDRYGPRILIFLMALFAGISLLLTSQTNSPWQLFLTYSLLLAAGVGGLYVVIMSTVSKWFDKKRGLALGIAGLGVGLGTVITAPLATYLITSFDWRMAYIVMGLITWLIVIPLSRLLKKNPSEIGVLPDGITSNSRNKEEQKLSIAETSLQVTGLSLRQALKTRSLWLVLFIYAFMAFGLLLVLTHLIPHATDIGLSAGEAAAVLSLMGAARAAGMVLMGSVSDRIGRKKTVIICSLLNAGTMLWLIWSQDLWMFCLFALVYGLSGGGLSPALAALIGNTFGLRHIGVIFGVIDIGFGVGAALGPAIGGIIFDVSNSYSLAFLLGALAMLVLPLLIAPIRRETNRNFEGT